MEEQSTGNLNESFSTVYLKALTAGFESLKHRTCPASPIRLVGLLAASWRGEIATGHAVPPAQVTCRDRPSQVPAPQNRLPNLHLTHDRPLILSRSTRTIDLRVVSCRVGHEPQPDPDGGRRRLSWEDYFKRKI